MKKKNLLIFVFAIIVCLVGLAVIIKSYDIAERKSITTNIVDQVLTTETLDMDKLDKIESNLKIAGTILSVISGFCVVIIVYGLSKKSNNFTEKC